jgi:hypothetical protein
MAASGTHYERAFEAYLQHRRIPCVAVNQARKAIFAGVQIKSFDMLIYPSSGPALLADVKGRKHSLNAFRRGRLGPNWVTRLDIEGLDAWQRVFGDDYHATFIFAYWLTGRDDGVGNVSETTDPVPDDKGIFQFDNRPYRFYRVDLPGYKRHLRPRSAQWDTVSIPTRQFRYLAEPF